MTDVVNAPSRPRASRLWLLAVGVLIADAAAWLVGSSFGLVGMVVAIAVILATQRKADAYWRAHNGATGDAVA